MCLLQNALWNATTIIVKKEHLHFYLSGFKRLVKPKYYPIFNGPGTCTYMRLPECISMCLMHNVGVAFETRPDVTSCWKHICQTRQKSIKGQRPRERDLTITIFSFNHSLQVWLSFYPIPSLSPFILVCLLTHSLLVSPFIHLCPCWALPFIHLHETKGWIY